MSKDFYDKHKNFSSRTSAEYFISPGIRCKFDLLKVNIDSKRSFKKGIDLGCSGNSLLCFLDNISHKFFYDIASPPLKQYINGKNSHPLCGDAIQLPYRDETFDFLCALDVLEHIKHDEFAVSEIGRILKKNALVAITVPHRMKFYTNQDQLIGHYRRYEISQIISLFEKFNLKHLKSFGVYGRIMKIAEIQSTSPEGTEEKILKLRHKYETNQTFRKIWDLVVNFLSKLMKLDVKYLSLKKIMNIAFIFKKV